MVNYFKNFWSSEEGAVTVDWVVLTAAVVALAGVAMANLYTPTANVGDGVGDYMTNTTVGN